MDLSKRMREILVAMFKRNLLALNDSTTSDHNLTKVSMLTGSAAIQIHSEAYNCIKDRKSFPLLSLKLKSLQVYHSYTLLWKGFDFDFKNLLNTYK